MAAYRTADRLFPGCHKAQLFIGMEYLRTNNLKTALMSFKDAQRINEQDPLVFNEIAVVYYKQRNYDAAKEELSRALSLCHDATQSQTYETILLNLAHC
jgi:anaphase-promoting complex subunit 6